jgi:DNA-binding response OmpR family regulator
MQKILIIEDELAYVRLLRDKLGHSYRVIHATDGKEGLRLALKEKPDLILLDVRMPKMDGLSVLHELRRDTYGKKAKVILLTNLEASDKIVIRVTKDLPTYYFVKSDVELDYVLEKIQDLLQGAVT